MRIPRWLIAVGVVVAGAGGGLYWLSLPPESLTVVSWGESYGRAQTLALFHPYTDTSGVNVAVKNYGGGLKEIAQQVEIARLRMGRRRPGDRGRRRRLPPGTAGTA